MLRLLLDLHNLYANAVNFRGDPASAAIEALSRLPLDHGGTVHIAGGRWLAAGNLCQDEKRWRDDHLHPVPDARLSMLEELAALAPQPLTVVRERDGAYPAMDELLLELQLARGAMRRGRKRQSQTTARPKSPVKIARAGGRSARLETLWAPIYLDEPLRASLLASPEEFAHSHDLTAEEAAALASIVGQAWRWRCRVSRKRQLREANQH